MHLYILIHLACFPEPTNTTFLPKYNHTNYICQRGCYIAQNTILQKNCTTFSIFRLISSYSALHTRATDYKYSRNKWKANITTAKYFHIYVLNRNCIRVPCLTVLKATRRNKNRIRFVSYAERMMICGNGLGFAARSERTGG